MGETTLELRMKQLQAATPKVKAKIFLACKNATIRAVEKASELTPTRSDELRGTNTQTGTMQQDWAAKSKIVPAVDGDKYTTELNNDKEYASYVNDGHRMNRHFVPGLVINQNGVLEMNPDGKGGIIVGTKTAYVPGLHITDKAIKVWQDTLEKELSEIGEILK